MYTKKSTAGLVLLLAILGVGLLGYNNKKNKIQELNNVTTPTVQETSSSEMVDLPTAAATSTTTSDALKEQSITNNTNLALRTDAEWKKVLPPNQYAVLRAGGTEQPYTSTLLNEKRKGSYVTADCGELVFRSEQKFDSGTGWPSFYAPAKPGAVIEKKDTELAVARKEIVSAKCSSHLGHVFDDAPGTPTGLRYCINGLALRFIPD